jgi:serine/threonine protein kinase
MDLTHIHRESHGPGDWRSHVYRAVDRGRNETIPVKVSHRSFNGSQGDWKHSPVFREVAILIRINHPCILAIIGCNICNGNLEFATEFFENRSLDTVLTNRRRARGIPEWFNATGITIIVAGIVLGMRHIHARGLIHFNFKPQAVLIDPNRRPQIGSFCVCHGMAANMTDGRPPLAYSAPEILMEKGYDQSCDVFSFGLVLFELIVGPQVFTGETHEIKEQIKCNVRPEIPVGVFPGVRELITRCWSHTASDRPTFQEVFATLNAINFALLPDADVTQVRAYVAEVEAIEKMCVMTPITLD